jgi:cysteine desulfurase/selenocysteine lyase
LAGENEPVIKKILGFPIFRVVFRVNNKAKSIPSKRFELMDIGAIRDLFPGLTGKIYLNTASSAIGCLPARQAYELALSHWSDGIFDFDEAEKAGEEVRAAFAAIVGAEPREVALVPNVSTAAGMVAAQLLAAKTGENILVGDIEFSSNFFPWLLLRDRGYEVRIVPSENGALPVDAYAGLADHGTRLIAVSAVQSSSGYRIDLKGLSEIAARSKAWLFVDACQAAGAIDLDVRRDGIDFLATSSHKFLLGTRGMGYFYVRNELLDKVRPVLPGWKAARDPSNSFYGPKMDLSSSASKMDSSLAWFPAMAERASSGVIQRFGLNEIIDRNSHLTQFLYERLADAGMTWKPFAPENRSTIVSVPVIDPAGVMGRLRNANVVASVRAGAVRLSAHFYNLEEEIDRVVEILVGFKQDH